MFAGYDFDVIQRSAGYLFRDGMTFTLTLTFLAMLGGIVFGTLLAMMRLSKFSLLSYLAGGYVNLMRSLPLVLVIFWFFFLVPYLYGWAKGEGRPIPIGAFHSALITFTMFEAAYYCEIMRAGIQSVARGQLWASYALGLNYWLTMGKIVLPQAFRNMLPVPGHVARVRDLGHRLPRRCGQGRQPRLPPGRDVHLRRRGLLRDVLRPVDAGQAAAAAHRHHPLNFPARIAP
jgi:His/Glu/Gln/Arg/opine family amino acid ABC transporter permease subunit